MEQVMKLTEAIEAAIEASPTASPSDLAANVLRHVRKDDLAPLLVDHLTRMQRDRTRETERQAFRKLMDREFREPINFPAATPQQGARTLARLASERFTLADGTVVDWLKATIEDHLARISYLRSIQARYNQGVDDTVRRHEEAVALIEAAGVSCLDEIDDPVSAA
jgi:hypothetical protein